MAPWLIRAVALSLLANTLPIAARGLYGPPGAMLRGGAGVNRLGRFALCGSVFAWHVASGIERL